MTMEDEHAQREEKTTEDSLLPQPQWVPGADAHNGFPCLK